MLSIRRESKYCIGLIKKKYWIIHKVLSSLFFICWLTTYCTKSKSKSNTKLI